MKRRPFLSLTDAALGTSLLPVPTTTLASRGTHSAGGVRKAVCSVADHVLAVEEEGVLEDEGHAQKE